MVKKHHYSHERESEGAHYLHFLLIMVFLLMEFGVVVVCVLGGIRLTAGRGLSAGVQGGRIDQRWSQRERGHFFGVSQ